MVDTGKFSRRRFLTSSLSSFGVLSLGPSYLAMATPQALMPYRSLKELGPLGLPNNIGMRLPGGFQSRIIAESGSQVALSGGGQSRYRWHTFPDGGACFKTVDGGWVYVSNSEVPLSGGGVGAIRFDAKGQILDAYSILSGTTMNCAGGPTPWGTWLSCEEFGSGHVFECDPFGNQAAVRRNGLGTFKHEAAAVDPIHGHVYLTEDESDGCFYRFTPRSIASTGRMDLDRGLLEVAIVNQHGIVDWQALDNPNPGLFQRSTRRQVAEATRFNGGEGIWFHDGLVTFTSKGDNRVWSYDTDTSELSIIYEPRNFENPPLNGVDNVTVSADGHILVAEDGGDMQIVVMGPYGDIYPLMQLVGQDHSEVTGPAFNPQQSKLYFSSQRGPGRLGRGITYEISGNFG